MYPTHGNPLQDTRAKLTAYKAGQVLALVYSSVLSEKDVYVCERLAADGKIRSKVKQSGSGKNPTCPGRTGRG